MPAFKVRSCSSPYYIYLLFNACLLAYCMSWMGQSPEIAAAIRGGNIVCVYSNTFWVLDLDTLYIIILYNIIYIYIYLYTYLSLVHSCTIRRHMAPHKFRPTPPSTPSFSENLVIEGGGGMDPASAFIDCGFRNLLSSVPVTNCSLTAALPPIPTDLACCVSLLPSHTVHRRLLAHLLTYGHMAETSAHHHRSLLLKPMDAPFQLLKCSGCSDKNLGFEVKLTSENGFVAFQ